MFLKEKSSSHKFEVMDLNELFSLQHKEITGRYHHSERVQDPVKLKKTDLVFLSGEELPRYWTDPHYLDN